MIEMGAAPVAKLLTLAVVSYVGGEILNEVGHARIAKLLNIISWLLGFKVTLDFVKEGIQYASTVFHSIHM